MPPVSSEDPLDDVGTAEQLLRRAVPAAREREPLFRQVRRRRSGRRPGGRQPTTAPRPTMPAPKTTQVDPGANLGRVSIAAPIPVREAATRTGRPDRAAPRGSIFAQRDLRPSPLYSANVDVPMKWRIGSPPREKGVVVPSGRCPWLCCSRIARQEVRAVVVNSARIRGTAVEKERDDMVAGARRRRRPSPIASTTPAPLVSEHRRRVTGGIRAPTPYRGLLWQTPAGDEAQQAPRPLAARARSSS